MKLFSENNNYKLYQGNMLDMLDVIEKNSIESIVTDPPYELNFMGKGWDNAGISFQKETWEKCFEVLKPGGYLLAFGGSRTFHRIACAIEDAGFEIRDTVMWLYGSGFPKSMNIGKGVESKLTRGSANKQEFKNLEGTKVKGGDLGYNSMHFNQGDRPNDYNKTNESLRTDKVDYKTELGKKYDGWGTALKPAYEPIIVARKPFKGSCVDNVIKYGVGGLNIDECRVGTEERTHKGMSSNIPENAGVFRDDAWVPKDIEVTVEGRFPANVILTYGDEDYHEVCDGFPVTKSTGGSGVASKRSAMGLYEGGWNREKDCAHLGGLGDEGSASRYFYCAKASKKDREEGLSNFDEGIGGSLRGTKQQDLKTGSGNERNNKRKNTHPTVKPTELMQYLVRLVTPENGTVLDPFNGSGSTGKAVMYENWERNKGYKYIGIELEEEYLETSKARIEYVLI